jgi:flagellar protein FliO/FliZ
VGRDTTGLRDARTGLETGPSKAQRFARPAISRAAWLARACTGLLAACAAVALSVAPAVFAQGFSRTLNDVRVSLAGGQELLTLSFSAPAEDNPIEEHQPGSFRLRFSATGSKVSGNLFQLKEQSTVQDYRVVPTAYATEVHVTLRDPRLNLQGRLAYERSGNLLLVRLPGAAAAAPGAAADAAILAQAERRLAGEGLPGGAPALPAQAPAAPAPLGQGDAPAAFEEGWLTTLLTMAVALAVVLGLLYGLVWAYNRFLGSKLGPRGGMYPIRHLGSFAVGPRQRIVILDINGEVIACGVTPQHISLVARLGGSRPATQPKPAASAAAHGAPAPGVPAVAAAPAAPAAAKDSAAKDPGKDPVHTFAETLKEKVRSLKRLK